MKKLGSDIVTMQFYWLYFLKMKFLEMENTI